MRETIFYAETMHVKGPVIIGAKTSFPLPALFSFINPGPEAVSVNNYGD